MREDELATAVVEHFEAAFDDAEIRLEEPYNHYGTRGVVDVYARTAPPERVSYLAELKADPAVRMASGANEILRQYRRTERYFYRDDAHDLRTALARDGPGLHLLLLFAPTPDCVEHVIKHRSLYASIDPDLAVDGVPAVRKVAFLVNLDAAADGGLGFLSVNSGLDIGSAGFRAAVPDGSRLAGAIDEADIDAGDDDADGDD